MKLNLGRTRTTSNFPSGELKSDFNNSWKTMSSYIKLLHSLIDIVIVSNVPHYDEYVMVYEEK
jgi:hypothetical protein